jgi:uncharacterized Fe-S cluster-containing radical SAM superfamily protein
MAYNINPERLGESVLNRIIGKGEVVDEPVFALYSLGRRLRNDVYAGETYVNDVVGCNYRCAHCWVSEKALNGNIHSDFVVKRISQFPGKFRGKLIHKADDVFDYLQNKANGKRWKAFTFTGGETSFYRGGLKRIGERARESDSPIAIEIDTNGWLISRLDNYLDAFDGLQDVMNFYVSVKGTTPEDFSRFTGVAQEHYNTALDAIEKLLRRGFKAVPGGVVLNTISYGRDVEETAERLHKALSRIHPQLPTLVAYHRISTFAHDQQALSRRLKSRGYVNTKPSEFERVLVNCFDRLGTPIIGSLPENKNVPGIISKDKKLQEIIADLRK